MSSTLWTIVTIAAVVGAVGMGLILKSLHKQFSAVISGFQAWQLRFKYTEKDVVEARAQLGSSISKFSLLFVPMLFFAGLCMAVVAHNAAEMRWLRHTMYGLTALACLFGCAETLLLTGKKSAKAAPVCSLLKWACFAVWTAGMFIGLFIRSAAL